MTIVLVGQTTPTTGGTVNGSAQVWWPTAGFIALNTGYVTALNTYVTSLGTATTLMLALYDASGNLLVATSAAIASGLNAQSTASFPVVTAGLTYYPAWQANAAIAIADDGQTFKAHQTSNTFGSMPSTIPVGGGTIGPVGVVTIWASGNPVGGGSGPLPKNYYVLP